MDLASLKVLTGLLNAMLGSSMLTLPVAAINGGYLVWGGAIVLFGIIQGFNSYLLIKHLGEAKSVEHLIFSHFSNNTFYLEIYNFVIWASLVTATVLYFPLFCEQIQGLIGDDSVTFLSEAALIFIICWVLVLRKCEIDDVALGIGVISILAFLIFVGWEFYGEAEGFERDSETSLVGSNPATITIIIINIFSTQDYLLQVMIEYRDKAKHTFIVVALYLCGGAMMVFICGGSESNGTLM